MSILFESPVVGVAIVVFASIVLFVPPRRSLSQIAGVPVGDSAECPDVFAGRLLPGCGLDILGAFTSALLEGVAGAFLEHSGDLGSRYNLALGGKKRDS